MQKCSPIAKARWRFGTRVVSNRSGIFELRPVSVRRADEQHQWVTLPDPTVTQRHILARDPDEPLVGALEAQDLLDGRDQTPWVLADRGELIRVPRQQEDAVADQRCRRDVSSDEHRHARREELALADPVGSVDRGGEATDHIVTRVQPSLGRDVGEIFAHRVQAGLAGEDRLIGGPVATQECVQAGRPVLDLELILAWHAEDIGDDGRRKRKGEFGDEVDRSRPIHAVQELIDDGGDDRTRVLHDARVEDPIDQGTLPGVIGRIGVQQADAVVVAKLGEARLLFGAERRDRRRDAAAGRIGSAVLAQDRLDVRVARDHPGAPGLAPMDRVLNAQSRVGGVRVFDESIREQVLVERVGERGRHLVLSEWPIRGARAMSSRLDVVPMVLHGAFVDGRVPPVVLPERALPRVVTRAGGGT